jgi:uncharacterized membrane protein
MRMILLLHILAGGLGLLSGYVALYASKGAPLHRRSGMLFVSVMLTMSVTGMLISAVEGVTPAINVPAASLTFYLVITSLTTVRPAVGGSHRLDIAAMLMALVIGLGCVALAFVAIANGGGGAGLAFPLFLFGVVGLLASAGDLRMIRAGSICGAPRLARHLWRMCFALFIASVAFYPRLGRAGVPKPLLALPVLAVLAIMFYWLWRVRVRRKLRDIGRVSAPEVTVSP